MSLSWKAISKKIDLIKNEVLRYLVKHKARKEKKTFKSRMRATLGYWKNYCLFFSEIIPIFKARVIDYLFKKKLKASALKKWVFVVKLIRSKSFFSEQDGVSIKSGTISLRSGSGKNFDFNANSVLKTSKLKLILSIISKISTRIKFNAWRDKAYTSKANDNLSSILSQLKIMILSSKKVDIESAVTGVFNSIYNKEISISEVTKTVPSTLSSGGEHIFTFLKQLTALKKLPLLKQMLIKQVNTKQIYFYRFCFFSHHPGLNRFIQLNN